MKPYPKYKDSIVAWIGDVPEHWNDKRLKYCLTLINDKNVDDSTNKIALENIESRTGKYIETSTEFAGNGVAFKQNDILFGKLRPYLAKVWQAEFDGNAVGDIFVYQANKEIVPRFAFYRFISRDFIDIVNGSTFGAKMPRASSEFIGNLTFVYPLLPEQTAIAAYLDCKTAQIDILIEQKRRLIELLQEERTALISHAVTKGLNPAVPMKDSGVKWIGEVLVGWEVVKLKWLTEVKLSNVDKKSKDNETTVQLCNYVDVYYHEKITSDLNFMTATARKDQIEALSLEGGDVLITKDSESPDDIAVPAFVDQTLPGVVCGYHLAHIRPDKNVANGNYLARAFVANGIRDQFEVAANGITRFGIGKDAILNSLFPFPPLAEQTAIAAYLDRKTAQIDQTIARAERQIELLQEYRTALISAAVTGKIDVREKVSELQS